MSNDKESFLKYWKEYITTISNYGSRMIHATILKKLEKYLSSINQTDLLFKDITPDFLRQFREYLLERANPKPLTQNSTIHYFKIIKSIINQSIADNCYAYSEDLLRVLNSILLKENLY
jgi:hypothetical protein